jgi:hypothetical protein
MGPILGNMEAFMGALVALAGIAVLIEKLRGRRK